MSTASAVDESFVEKTDCSAHVRSRGRPFVEDSNLYRSLSRPALIASVVSLFGLFAFMLAQLLVLPMVAFVVGWIDWRKRSAYPAEFSVAF